MIIKFCLFLILTFLNYLVVYFSNDIDLEQLYVEFLNLLNVDTTIFFLSFFSSSIISLVTVIMLKIFHPFIEIYLMHYYKLSFYILVNLFSLSSVFIVLRIYGYSRLFVLFYVLLSSVVLVLFDKIKKD